jgi:hypothetical protein
MREKETDLVEVNRLHRELLAMLPRDLYIAAPVCASLMATIAATFAPDRATRQKVLSIMCADAQQLAESPTAPGTDPYEAVKWRCDQITPEQLQAICEQIERTTADD